MDYLMLIDRFYPIPGEVLSGLRFGEAGGVIMEEQAARQLGLMLSKAREDGVAIKALSGYRSPEYQEKLRREDTARRIAEGLSPEEAAAQTDRYLARPLCSEHNSGLAVDLCTPSADDTEDDFFLTPQAKWLCRNAHRFGFILRYPRMKEHITGIAYEPWHYRYVGTEAALLIHQSGLCLEEFLHFYADEFSFEGLRGRMTKNEP